MKVFFLSCDDDYQSHVIPIGIFSSIDKANKIIDKQIEDYKKDGVELPRNHWQIDECKLDEVFNDL